MNHSEAVETMLGNLDDWRHLPKYQLERRADLFFALFIREIVSARVGREIHPLVLPEFPFRYNRNNTDTSHTVNFDYVLFSADLGTMYVVELKTDADSYREAQEEYLEEALGAGFAAMIAGLNDVFRATSQRNRRKYRHLFGHLARAGLVTATPELAPLRNPDVQLLYLGPPPASRDLAARLRDRLIELKEAAEILEKTGGAVESLFAGSLRRWQERKAGDTGHE